MIMNEILKNKKEEIRKKKERKEGRFLQISFKERRRKYNEEENNNNQIIIKYKTIQQYNIT